MQVGRVIGIWPCCSCQCGCPANNLVYFSKGIATEGIGIFPLCEPVRHCVSLVTSLLYQFFLCPFILKGWRRWFEVLRDKRDQLLLLSRFFPRGEQFTHTATILCKSLSKTMDICYYRSLISLVRFEIWSVLLGGIDHVGK